MKTAFIIAGPESAGNHLTTQLFCMAGCAGGDLLNKDLVHFIEGRLHDITNIIGQASKIVHLESVPRAHVYRPDLPSIKRRFESSGFKTLTIIVFRDWYANVKSKVLHGHQPTEAMAWSELPHEWIHIGQSLLHLRPFYILNTSYMFLAPERALFGLEQFTGLRFPQEAKDLIKDVDAKHYTSPLPNP